MKMTLLKTSNAVALAGIDFEISFAKICANAAKASEIFSKKPSKIAIFAENSPEWIFSLFGAWHCGATVVPVDAKSSAEELAFILGDSETEFLMTSRENLDTAKAAAAQLKNPIEIVVADEVFAGELNGASAPAEIFRDTSELALIVYTSGTTGKPKGVMLTFENMRANMCAVVEAKYFYDGIRVLTMLPFHHILPLMGTLVMPLSIGGKLVFPRSLAPSDIAEVLQKHHVDMIISVPRFYELLHTNIMAKISHSKIAKAMFGLARMMNSESFSRALFASIQKKFGGEVKFWVSGGASLDRKVWRDLDTLGFGIREGYGMTECAPIISFPRIGRNKIGSPGEPLPGIEVRIVDGEIAVRGCNVTSGYYKRPEETAEAIRNGWLYTGDLGYVDEDGFIFITGRRKEIIVLPNGKNVDPAEIETNLRRQSADILECGVLMYENMLQAIIRVKPELLQSLGAEAAEEKLRNEAVLPYNRAAASYKRIIRFVLTAEDLPRTRVGKLKRFQLASYIENIGKLKPKTQAEPEPTTRIYGELKEVLASQISMPVSADAHMEMDLGMDSLGKISLQCFVKENYGVEVSERDFEKCSSLRKFAALVEKNRDESFEPQTKNVTWADIIAAQPYPRIPSPNFFHFATISLFRLFSKLCYKVRWEGLENLPESESVIVAPNHQSYLDGMFVVESFTKTQIYKTYFFAKLRKIIKSGLIRKFADRSNVIVMDINDKVSESIRKLAQALRAGNRVVVFPEGTRTKDGKIAEFKQTFAILAKEMKVAVVPVAISGAFEAVKVGGTLPKFGSSIRVRYLPKIFALENESYEEFAARVRAAVEAAWAQMKSQ